MGQREEQQLVGSSVMPPEEDTYLTVEEAVAFLDGWANSWNYPPLLKPKGLPPKEKQP